MKYFRLSLFLFLLFGFLHVKAQRFSIPTTIYDSSGNFVANSKMEFNIYGKCYQIFVRENYIGQLCEFCPEKRACVSTSYTKTGIRYWFTGAYYDANDKVRDYFVTIFDPTPDGRVCVYFRTCEADKVTMKGTKYCYYISKDGWDKVSREFITPATLDLKVVKQGDIFGDGVHKNPYVNN